MKNEAKQDKVNCAVSEREDRVTDVMTLTRMTGCTGLQLGCTELYELYWAVLTGLYWDVLGFTWLYLAVLACTGLYWDVLGCT